MDAKLLGDLAARVAELERRLRDIEARQRAVLASAWATIADVEIAEIDAVARSLLAAAPPT